MIDLRLVVAALKAAIRARQPPEEIKPSFAVLSDFDCLAACHHDDEGAFSSSPFAIVVDLPSVVFNHSRAGINIALPVDHGLSPARIVRDALGPGKRTPPSRGSDRTSIRDRLPFVQ